MITLNPAEARDWARVYAWRNEEQARANSGRTEAITLEQHMRWFKDALQRTTTHLYVARDGARSITVGSGRLDYDRRTATLSLAIDVRYRGQGYAEQVIAALLEQSRLQGATRALAQVAEANAPSLRAFAGLGFRPSLYKDEWVTLALDHAADPEVASQGPPAPPRAPSKRGAK